MNKFKYKLKELKKGDIEVRGGIKSTVTDVNPETGTVSWDIEDIEIPNYNNVFRKFIQLKDSLKKLSINKKDDPKFNELSQKIISNFNDFRTHLRNKYPDEYVKIQSSIEDLELELQEISSIGSNSGFTSGGEGENHTGSSPKKSTKGNYGAYSQVGYKKVKPLQEETDVEDYLSGLNISDSSKRKFIYERLKGFDNLEIKLNQLIPLMQKAKHDTLDYYRQNPESYEVIYGTDLANDYLDDLITLFKK